MVEVLWSRMALKQWRSIDKRYQKAISEKVNELENFPAVTLDIKKLKAEDGKYRLRVGAYRVIFKLTDGEPPIICTIEEVKRRTSTTY